MSYDVSLHHPDGSPVEVTPHTEGGTYNLFGESQADLNITYNYGKHYWEVLGEGGLRSLHGKRAGDVSDQLAYAVQLLGTDRDSDYWKPTEGNAGYALSILLGWARANPDAIFEVE